MTLGATRRFARSLGPGTAERLAVAYGIFPSRRSPLCLSDSGCALTGPLLVARCFPVARVSSQPDRGHLDDLLLFWFKCQVAEVQNHLWIGSLVMADFNPSPFGSNAPIEVTSSAEAATWNRSVVQLL